MQTIIHKKYVVDEKGKKTAVIIEAKEYKKMMRLYIIFDSFKVILTLFMIRLFGLLGVALTMVLTDTLAAVIYQPYASRYLGGINLKKEIYPLLLGFLAILSASCAGIFIFHLNQTIIAPLALLAYIIYILCSKIITPEEIGYVRSIFK